MILNDEKNDVNDGHFILSLFDYFFHDMMRSSAAKPFNENN